MRQRPAKPCTRVRFPSPPPVFGFPGAISSAGERFPDTEEVTGSIPVSRTSITACQSVFSSKNLRPVHATCTTRRQVTLVTPERNGKLGGIGRRALPLRSPRRRLGGQRVELLVHLV